ncbi:MAG: hypothetical protein ABJA80_09050 [bacterium]
MHRALLLLAAQLHVTTIALPQGGADHQADSTRDLDRARGAQAAFERGRRAMLPRDAPSGSGRCEVRLGRFCWWYDERPPVLPPEAEQIGRRRRELVAALDQLAARYPGDDWLAGMRVHYRVDGRDFAGADSVAATCAATAWWCSALRGYAAHAGGNALAADSAFASALDAMAPDSACAWRSIAPLLPDDARKPYERTPCATRQPLERRFWMLSRPRLAAAANEWQNEFNVRRVLVRMGEHAMTPHLVRWGWDAAELVLRYGWPVAWTQVTPAMAMGSEVSVVGYDPSPSFDFAPESMDSIARLPPDAWHPRAPAGKARFAPRLVRRMADASAQIARFPRHDSTVVVAAFAAEDDSLRQPAATLSVVEADGTIVTSTVDSARVGRAMIAVRGAPLVAGVELLDTLTRTLARTREAYAAASGPAGLVLSDLLLYRPGAEPAASLDSALARAIPGDTVGRGARLGVFWEMSGLEAGVEAIGLTVTVERVDHGWLRSTRQRLGLAPEDAPIRIKWMDAAPPVNHILPHAIALDLANLDTGRYRLALTLTVGASSPVTATREIALLDR